MDHCDTCKCDTLSPDERARVETDETVRLIRERRESGRPDPGIREVARFLGRAPMTGGVRRDAALRMLDGDGVAPHPNDNFADLASADDRPMFGPWSS